MDFNAIFREYYTLFRGDSTIPTTTDPEWAIGVREGNSAIRRWANVDGEEWDVLWTIASAEGFGETYTGTSASPTITTYDCPDNMSHPGGYITMTDPVSGTFIRISVCKLQDVQSMSQSAPFAYFTGGEQEGYQMTLHFSGSSNNGWTLDFPMYKTPTYFDDSLAADGVSVNEDGSTVTEVPDSNFIINSMLAKRLFQTRNPFFQQAKADSEVNLKNMQQKNGIGTPGSPWNLNDSNKTGIFGI